MSRRVLLYVGIGALLVWYFFLRKAPKQPVLTGADFVADWQTAAQGVKPGTGPLLYDNSSVGYDKGYILR